MWWCFDMFNTYWHMILVFTCHMKGTPNIWMKFVCFTYWYKASSLIRKDEQRFRMCENNVLKRYKNWKKKKKSYWWEKITQSGNSSGLEKIMSYGVLLFILSTIPVKIIKLRTLKSVQIHAVHTLTNSNVHGHSL